MRNERYAQHRLWLLWCLALLLGLAAPVPAAELYRVTGITVDQTAESAAVARERAIDQGQRDGLYQLLARLTPADAQGRLSSLPIGPIERYVESFDIADERVAPTRYMASLNVSFVPEEVQTLLRQQRVPFVEAPSPPLLVLPLWQDDAEPGPWGEADPWRTAWDREIEKATVARLRLPLGDLADLSSFPPVAVRDGDAAALTAAKERYQAEAVYIAAAAFVPPAAPEMPPSLQLDVRNGDRFAEPLLQEVVPGQPEELPEALLARGVAAVIGAIEQDWKNAHAIRVDQMASLDVEVPLVDLESWVQIRERLASLPEVQDVRVRTFQRRQASITLAHAGDVEALRGALDKEGLWLAQENGAWLLRRAGDRPELPAQSPGLLLTP